MKVGDLVRLKNIWKEWVKHNPWMDIGFSQKIGIIVATNGDMKPFVLWPDGVQKEWQDNLEVISEKS